MSRKNLVRLWEREKDPLCRSRQYIALESPPRPTSVSELRHALSVQILHFTEAASRESPIRLTSRLGRYRGPGIQAGVNTQTDIERCAVEGSAEIKMFLSGCFCLHAQLREFLRRGRGYGLGLTDKYKTWEHPRAGEETGWGKGK